VTGPRIPFELSTERDQWTVQGRRPHRAECPVTDAHAARNNTGRMASPQKPDRLRRCRTDLGPVETVRPCATRTLIMTNVPKTEAKDDRYAELAKILEGRRHELANAVQDRRRDARADNIVELDVLDEGESSEADTQEEIEFALLQMKTETLNKITLALQRLAEGTYGSCVECGADIAAARLRALPFAARCTTCEEAHESAEWLERTVAQRRPFSAVTFDVSR